MKGRKLTKKVLFVAFRVFVVVFFLGSEGSWAAADAFPAVLDTQDHFSLYLLLLAFSTVGIAATS
jgi:hypothetical protein